MHAACHYGDPALLQAALGDSAKARGMTCVARQAGLGRESLYKALTEQGNPSWQTITKVLGALGLRLAVMPSTPAAWPAVGTRSPGGVARDVLVDGVV